MIEAVFGDSAGGSLSLAQAMGTSAYLGCTVGVIFDGDPTPEEREEALRQTEEHYRKVQEETPPLGGNPADVFPFSLGLSMGDLSRIQPPDSLAELKRRFEAGEKLRVWYSNQPDEQCGLYWLMDQLSDLEGEISYIKLPEFVFETNAMVHRLGCGELAPEDWHKLLPLEKPLSPILRRHYASAWKKLVEENAPLRAVVNGQVSSVPENLYDHYVRWEIAAAEPEFYEAKIIGSVLGKYELRISDMWVHERIEKMVQSGELTAVTEAEDGCPYRRSLRRTNLFTI